MEAARDFLVDGIEAEGEIGGEHGGHATLGRVLRIRHHVVCANVPLRLPLMGSGGALGQLPFKFEEIVEEVVAPLGGSGGPCNFEPAADGVCALAGAEGAVPAEA